MILLPDGRVLLIGGYAMGSSGQESVSAAEIYDPATDTWSTLDWTFSSTGALLLPNGKVLLAGSTKTFDTALFDPVSGRLEAKPDLSVPKDAMTLLSDGRVLLVGETTSNIYDPASGKLSNVAPMNIGTFRFSARLLPDGRVLVRGAVPFLIHGGAIGWVPLPVIYNPKSNTVVSPTLRTEGVDVLLPSGNVLISGTIPLDLGGVPRRFGALGQTVLFDSAADLTLPQPSDDGSVAPAYFLLDDGRVFGIANGANEQSFVQVYTPPSYTVPAPLMGSVLSNKPVSDSDLFVLNIRGTSFLPNSVVQLGQTRLVTLYLGSTHLVAFVPPALRLQVSSGVSVSNPGPGGGTTDAVPIGFIRILPISDVETGAISTGYAIITPDSGISAAVSTLTYGIVHDGFVQSQAAILPTPLTTQTAVLVDVVQPVGRDLGLAIANASSTSALITLVLRNEDGTAASSTLSFSISARGQAARFVTELFSSNVIGAAFRGSLTIQSSIPVSIMGLRFSGQEFSTIPIQVTNPASVPQQGLIGGANAVMFPQFAMSGGWATTIGLVNTTLNTISGRIDLFDTSGNPLPIALNGDSQSTFTYSIPPRGSMLFAPRDANGQSPF